MADTPSLYSHHIFIFPFRWDFAPCDTAKACFSERTNLEKMLKEMKDSPETRSTKINLTWGRFRFDWTRDFNEAIYFHSFARDALFDNGQPKPGLGLQYSIPGYEEIKTKNETTGKEATERKSKNLEYRISLNDANACSVYQLEIEELTLNFYETGIGFFGFHLNNRQHASPEEILQINDFGRRIYPQFLNKEGDLLAGAKGAFLADKIEIVSDKEVLAADDFSGLLNSAAQSPDDSGWLIPGFVRGWLPAFLRIGEGRRGNVQISPLLDDRMFVVCWVGHDKWSSDLKLWGSERPHETDTRWHQLIFVDGKDPGMANPELLRNLNIAHTNTRWGGYGTFYGASRYSFATLTSSDFGRKNILPHVQSMYFQIALLCLLQRGSIVRFSDEIARLASSNIANDKEAEDLHRKYLQFINKIYFREVTPQEQGIELYRLLQEKMEIERDVKNLQGEIQDFFNLLKLQSDERQTEAMNTLTIVGSALLVPTLILAYYGLTTFPEFDDSKNSWFTFDWAWKISGAGMVIGFLSAWLWVRTRNSQYRYWAGLLAVLSVLGVLAAAVFCPKIWF